VSVAPAGSPKPTVAQTCQTHHEAIIIANSHCSVLALGARTNKKREPADAPATRWKTFFGCNALAILFVSFYLKRRDLTEKTRKKIEVSEKIVAPRRGKKRGTSHFFACLWRDFTCDSLVYLARSERP